MIMDALRRRGGPGISANLRLALADLTWSGQDSRASCEGPFE